jgi:hypothetical protein
LLRAVRVALGAGCRERLAGLQERLAGEDHRPAAVEFAVGVLAELVVDEREPA